MPETGSQFGLGKINALDNYQADLMNSIHRSQETLYARY